MELLETKFTRSEGWKQFKIDSNFAEMPSGTKIFKVKIIDGNTGSSSCEYATDDREREDMTAVSSGYFYECSWLTKK